MSLKSLSGIAALVVLLGVTVYGVYGFITSGSEATLDYWLDRIHLAPLVLAIAAIDIALECTAWLWVYSRFGIKSWDRGAVQCFLAGRAGLLLPAQLGRLISPNTMARQGRGKLSTCLKAEGVTFAINVASVGLLIVALIAALTHPLLFPVVVLGAITVLALAGDRVGKLVAHTRLALPEGLWRSPATFGIMLVQMAAWTAHGIGLWVLIKDLPGNAGMWQTVLFSSLAAVLGVGSGLPGGVGATEGLLGFALRLMHIPTEHLVMAVGGFRLATFWIWIPIGWGALVLARRRSMMAPAPAASAAQVAA
ncbi:MAG: hypothetical protein ACF8R7_15880 [Phycisphaerales bacterium JB039]